jgi:hypothetical protein
MAGRMEDLAYLATDNQLETIFRAQVWWRYGWRGDADPFSLLFHEFKERDVVLVEKNRSAGLLGEQFGTGDMVEVGMGDNNLPQFETACTKEAENLDEVATGIDDGGVVSLYVIEDGAIALEWANWKGFALH